MPERMSGIYARKNGFQMVCHAPLCQNNRPGWESLEGSILVIEILRPVVCHLWSYFLISAWVTGKEWQRKFEQPKFLSGPWDCAITPPPKYSEKNMQLSEKPWFSKWFSHCFHIIGSTDRAYRVLREGCGRINTPNVGEWTSNFQGHCLSSCCFLKLPWGLLISWRTKKTLLFMQFSMICPYGMFHMFVSQRIYHYVGWWNRTCFC